MFEDIKAQDGLPSNAQDIMNQLQTIISGRESSRRVNNNLLKPLSEIDMSQLRPEDKISSSYFRLPDNFPIPVSSGRDPKQTIMNDQFCSIVTGSENFKFKQKYEYEDNLFKNEDVMYSLDH